MEQFIGITILAVIVLGCALVLRPFISAIMWAIVLSSATWPLYHRVRASLGGRSALAAALMVTTIALVMVVPMLALGWSMADDVVAVAKTANSMLEKGLPSPPDWVSALPLVGTRLAQRWQELARGGAGVSDVLSPYLAGIKAQLLAVGSGLVHGLFELLVSLTITFFFYCNGTALAEGLGSVSDRLTGERGRRLMAVVASTSRSVVDGVLGANLMQAVLGGLGFWLAGVPGAMLLGFFLFFLSVVPLGAGLIWIPAVIWLASNGQANTAILLTGWCILVFPVLENIVRPYLIKRSSALPGLLVLLGMLGGLSAFGFLGLFLGPVLLALAYTLIEEWRAMPPLTGSARDV